jgi:hypothetical protein
MRIALSAVVFTALSVLPTSTFAEGLRTQNPYANLFTAQLAGVPAAQQKQPQPVLPQQLATPLGMQPASGQTVVVCGLTVMQGDAKIDGLMVHHPPANAPKPIITVMQPAVCNR